MLINYMFHTENKSKAIALIMAYHFFDIKERSKDINLNKAIKDAEKIVIGFEENAKIIDYLKSFLNPKRKRKSWHWSELSIEEIIKKYMINIDDQKLSKEVLRLKLSQLDLYHEGAHVNLDLSQDYLTNTTKEEIEYVNPLINSKAELLGFIGLARLSIQAIIKLVKENLELND